MDNYQKELESIVDTEYLRVLKEQIKNMVMNKGLTWQSRAYMYKQVQLINERLKELN